MNARLFFLFPMFLLSSCVHKYAVPVPIHHQSHLRAAATIYITTPRDGRDDRSRTYEGSGDWTSSAIANALRDRGMRVVIGQTVGKLSEAVFLAGTADSDFLVHSKIMHWSDRVTEWSGVPDRVTVNLMIYDVSTGKVLNRQQIKASSRWVTLGGDHPQELLPELMRRWAETVMK